MSTTSGQPLKHLPFQVPPLQIPNGSGEPFKTELVEVRSPERTVKWNFWHLPDDDRLPHNHPWDFESEIHHGSYTEKCFWLFGGETHSEICTYRAGQINYSTRDVFHLIIEVVPGTVTRMECGAATPNNEWGYLDSGRYVAAPPDPTFIARLCNLNRFLIPKVT